MASTRATSVMKGKAAGKAAVKKSAKTAGAEGGSAIDGYLAKVDQVARGALEKLRAVIRATAPAATEGISYQVPTFRHHGVLVGFGATDSHCAFYVMSGTVLGPFEAELAKYDTSKGTIRFAPEKPLPVALVKRIVRARMAENEARAASKATARGR